MEKIARITAEDVAFWIIIAIIIGIAIWKLFGSPTDTATIISVTLAIASSELLIWRSIFQQDKRTAVGFIKMQYETKDMKKEINNTLNQLNSKLESIDNLIRRKK